MIQVPLFISDTVHGLKSEVQLFSLHAEQDIQKTGRRWNIQKQQIMNCPKEITRLKS